jgi:Ni/Co efflux regulator RcnB
VRRKIAATRGRDDDRHGDSLVLSFGSEDRRIVSEYYGTQMRKGNCPPGLAKKNNGCQAPGQAKKWQRGQPLAKDIQYYELPMELRVRLPAPPPNHRYVQVAGDILMIATGTKMVVDAIEDILR